MTRFKKIVARKNDNATVLQSSRIDGWGSNGILNPSCRTTASRMLDGTRRLNADVTKVKVFRCGPRRDVCHERSGRPVLENLPRWKLRGLGVAYGESAVFRF